ncbi:hypothetical protein Aduo_018637 [Ancylostoma duodenale]
MRQFFHSYVRKEYTREELEFDRAFVGKLCFEPARMVDHSEANGASLCDLPVHSPNNVKAPGFMQAPISPTVLSAYTSKSQPSTTHSVSPTFSQTLQSSQRSATQASSSELAGEQR